MAIKKTLLLLFLMLLLQASLQAQHYCIAGRFDNENYFKPGDIVWKKDLVFSQAKNWQGNEEAIKADIAYPGRTADTLKKRPLVIIMHGGSFKKGNKDDYENYCQNLAQRGFVAATINYRLGWNEEAEEPKNGDPDSNVIMAVYRAQQDLINAINYFSTHSQTFGIDDSCIIIGGFSAGAFACLQAAFLNQEEWNKVMPWIEKKLGEVDHLHASEKIRGIIDMWGAIPDTNLISVKNARRLPILMFHGSEDKEVPYKHEPPRRGTGFFGSFVIAQRYRKLGACYQLNTKVGGGHGTGFDRDFICEKTGAFFKTVFCNTCKSEEFSTVYVPEFPWKRLVKPMVIVLVIITGALFYRKRKTVYQLIKRK